MLNTKVYRKLLQVPKGKVTTYGELAKVVGLKNGQRVIGMIMKKNPFPVIVPCHRVVKSDSKIGGNTVRNIAHLRTLIDEITSKRKGQK